MRKNIFSFGTWQYYEALEHLGTSVLSTNDLITVDKFTEVSIPTWFYKKHADHFKCKRGFGYWIWKSFFINRELDDVFIYADSGNLVTGDLTPIFEICKNDPKGIVLFDNSDGSPDNSVWKNNMWTKGDCFDLMGLTDSKYVYGNQVNASYIAFRKTDFSVKFFDAYAKCCENINIISDLPNICSGNHPEFRDHRHDQSILSLLAIKYNINIQRDPSQWGNSRLTPESPYGQVFDHHRRRFYTA